MAFFFVFVGAWLIGWGILLTRLLLRAAVADRRIRINHIAPSRPRPHPVRHHGDRPVIQTSTTRFKRANRIAAIALLALAASTCSNAAEPAAKTVGALHAERGWIRATPPNAPVAGGYVTLSNAGKTDDRLVSITTPAAARVEMHEMRMEGGAMQMRALPDGVAVKAGTTVEFKPGGSHLMFIGPTRTFKAGEQVEVTLRYAKAAPQTLKFAVQPLGSTAAPAATMEMPEDEGGHSHH